MWICLNNPFQNSVTFWSYQIKVRRERRLTVKKWHNFLSICILIKFDHMVSLVLYGTVWSCLVPYCPYGPAWPHMVPYCPVWFCMVPMVPYCTVRYLMVLYGLVWSRMVLLVTGKKFSLYQNIKCWNLMNIWGLSRIISGNEYISSACPVVKK